MVGLDGESEHDKVAEKPTEPVIEPVIEHAVEAAVEKPIAPTVSAPPQHRELDDYLIGELITTPEKLLQALEKQSRMPMIRVGEALLRLGYINQHQLDSALEKQKTDRSAPLGQLLRGMGFITQNDLNTALVRKMGYPVVDPTVFPIQAEVTLKISFAVAQRLHIMPLMRRGNTWVIAMTDPTLRATLDELEFILQARIAAVLADADRIVKAQQKAYGKLGQINDKSLAFDATHTADLAIKHAHQPQSSGTTNQLRNAGARCRPRGAKRKTD